VRLDLVWALVVGAERAARVPGGELLEWGVSSRRGRTAFANEGAILTPSGGDSISAAASRSSGRVGAKARQQGSLGAGTR
jgi:hypothetical protein